MPPAPVAFVRTQSIPFARTIWSSSDGSDDTLFNDLTGPMPRAGFTHFMIELIVDVDVRATEVTPVVQVSSDGETWTDMTFEATGSPGTSDAGDGFGLHGPFEVETVNTGEHLVRVGLQVDRAAGTEITIANVRGQVHLGHGAATTA